MKKKNHSIKFLLVVMLLSFSCKKEEVSLEKITLEIVDKEIHSKYFKGKEPHDLLVYEPMLHIIKFKITNNTEKTQVIYPICVRSRHKKGCSTFNSFPKKYLGLSYYNLIIEDEYDKELDPDFVSSGYLSDDRMFNYILTQDSLVNLHYIKLGYKTNKDNQVARYFNDNFYDENTIMVGPKEVLFFETYFSFPYNKTSYESSKGYFMFDKDKNYNLSLVFYSDTINVKKDMSRIQRLNHENNDREFFSGELKSKNSIPIIFH